MSTRKRGGASADGGFIVLGWMTKLALTMAVLGLIGFDAVALVSAKFSAADRAATYASDAATTYSQTKDIDKTYASVVSEASEKGDTVDIKTFSVQPNGTVNLTIHHTASTIWMQKVGFLKQYTKITESGSGTTGS